MRTAAVLAAAGAGTRLGGCVPKALAVVGEDPLVVCALRPLVAAGIRQVVVAAPPDRVAEVARLVRGSVVNARVLVVAGARSRRESVSGCLAEVGDADAILVHDAARPLVPVDVVRRVLAALEAGAAAVVPVVPLADTVKQVAAGRVQRTLPRESLRAVQTPQGFRADVLRRAHEDWSGNEPTDDAAMVEAGGTEVLVVDGDPAGFKVTGPLDLRLATAWTFAREA